MTMYVCLFVCALVHSDLAQLHKHLTLISMNLYRYEFQCADVYVGRTMTRRSACSEMDGKDLDFLARQHVDCGTNQALLSFKLVRDGCNGKDLRYEFTCGELRPDKIVAKTPPCLIDQAYHSGTMVTNSTVEFTGVDCQQKCAALASCNFWDWQGGDISSGDTFSLAMCVRMC